MVISGGNYDNKNPATRCNTKYSNHNATINNKISVPHTKTYKFKRTVYGREWDEVKLWLIGSIKNQIRHWTVFTFAMLQCENSFKNFIGLTLWFGQNVFSLPTEMSTVIRSKLSTKQKKNLTKSETKSLFWLGLIDKPFNFYRFKHHCRGILQTVWLF